MTAFAAMWQELAAVGRDADSGGYLRYAWSPAELALRDWFKEQAKQRDLMLEEDGNGNLFAWWHPDGAAFGAALGGGATAVGAAFGPASGSGAGAVGAALSSGAAADGEAGAGTEVFSRHNPDVVNTSSGLWRGASDTDPAGVSAPGAGDASAAGASDADAAGASAAGAGAASAGHDPGAVLTGSHFDSVPHGGGFDGPLGIVSALLAVDELRARDVTLTRPIGIAVFAEEEGSRFGLACLGSRLLTGAVDPAVAAALTDRDGITLAQALGGTPAGARPDLLNRIGCFVELHVEQGLALAELDRAVGVASAIWPHGRWRLDFDGEANHAGTTAMTDRRDPMLTFAFTVLAANKEARLRGAHATIGRVQVSPNATNAIPARVSAWLDARAAESETVQQLVAAVHAKAGERAQRDGTTVTLTTESVSPQTSFHSGLRDRLAKLLDDAPVLPTGAGHDAGVLSAHVPTAMLFVRNPTGVSHSPAESATEQDCAAGVRALADVLQELAC